MTQIALKLTQPQIEIVSIKSRVDYSGNTTHVLCPLSLLLTFRDRAH